MLSTYKKSKYLLVKCLPNNLIQLDNLVNKPQQFSWSYNITCLLRTDQLLLFFQDYFLQYSEIQVYCATCIAFCETVSKCSNWPVEKDLSHMLSQRSGRTFLSTYPVRCTSYHLCVMAGAKWSHAPLQWHKLHLM